MLQSKQYQLDFSKAIEFFNRKLDDVNHLSSFILRMASFSTGQFYSFLKEGLTDSEVNQYKAIRLGNDSIRRTILYMQNYLRKHSNSVLIIDDFNFSAVGGEKMPLFKKFGRYYRCEACYLFTSKDCDEKDILEAIQYSNTEWHSLAFIIDAPVESKEDKDIKSMVSKVDSDQIKMVLHVAYDAESYIIWERNS